MERIINPLIRVFLSFVLVVSFMPALSQPAHADEAEDTSENTASLLSQSATESAAQSEEDAGSSETIVNDQEEAAPLGFVYFAESDPIAGSVQQIAVSIDDQVVVTSATLVYRDPQGAVHEVAAEKCANSSALFSIQTGGPGAYQLIAMKAQLAASSDETKTVAVDLEAQGENCAFKVVADTGITLSIQSESEETNEEDVTIYALNAQGELEEADDLEGAVALAGSAGISAQAEGDEKFVIALDPGHGGSDPGAVWNGINEADINWKIAQACKAELEKYANVEVYITRTQNECPGLSERVTRAVSHGAKVFVSLHINSASASAKGAEVWYPNDSSYKKAETHTVAQGLSQNILNELVALGLSDRGIKTKDSANGSKYPDGSTRDYYGVIASARESGIPGIIVEHAFITNTEENKKLADDSFLVQLGQADARGIAKTYSLVKIGGTWEKQANGTWKYKQVNGTYATNTWITESNKRYWVDANGIMLTGVQTINGTTYYFDASGALQTKTGWQQIDNAWYYFSTSGAAQTGWVKVSGKWYYFDPSTAKMATGWVTVDGKKYFLNTSGAMRTSGWFKDGNDWYWITSSGAAQTGWVKVSGKWYYLDPSTAKMATGWANDGKDWYYLNSPNGDMKTGWLKDGSTWYYLQSSGAMATGWISVGGKKYYLNQSGAMLTGEQVIDGERCFFEPSNGAFVGNGTPIMGTSKVNAARMTTAYLASGKTYPSALAAGGAPDPAAFCKIIEEEANAEGVRAEVVWAQIMWETGWLQMGNDVSISQYNFAGLGATGNGVAGASFPDVRTGIRAQVQHLKCYASTEPLNGANVDPRWSTYLRGKAKLVEWLGIPENPNGTGWAASKEYGYNLRSLMENKLGV